jgi:hypothetical protein
MPIVLLCANGVRSALTVSTSVTSSLVFLNVCFLHRKKTREV